MSRSSRLSSTHANLSWGGLGLLAGLVLGVAVMAFFLVRSNSGGPASSGPALSSDQRMIRIADRLQCPICEGQSVAFSNSQLAAEMRRTIEEKLQAGESEEAIIQYFVDRYGIMILREPPRQGLTTWLWLTPVLGIGLAILLLIWRLRRMATASAASDPTGASPEEGPLDPKEFLDPEVEKLVRQYDKDLLA